MPKLSPSRPQYSIILPVYNEQETIKKVYARVCKAIDKLGKKYEIIFVNDGSVDNSKKLLRSLVKVNSCVKVVNFSRNFGHQMAVTAGLAVSRGMFVAVLDADLQDPPELLPRFIKKALSGYDVVYAIRKNRTESPLKRLAYRSFYRTLHKIAQISIPLDAGDFCVMSRRVVDVMNAMPERNRFVRGLRSWVGFTQVGIEYDRVGRLAGKSKYSITGLFRLAFDGIFSFSYVPLKMITALGFMSIALSALGTVWVAYQRFFTQNYDAVPGFATTVILIMFFGGLQLFSLGLVGEYVKRMYDETKSRPQYVIESKIGF